MSVKPVEVNFILPTAMPGVVVIIAKHSARFKVVDLNALSEDFLAKKLEAYQHRFVKVLESSEHARQVFISPQAPHMIELMNSLENLTLDGKKISKISVLSKAEYQDFSEEVIESVKVAKKEISLKKEAEETKSDDSTYSFSMNNLSFISTKASLSASISALAFQVGKCFHDCSAKILEIFLETERRMAELDKEAAEEKAEKKKAEKKEIIKDELERVDLKVDLLKSEAVKASMQ